MELKVGRFSVASSTRLSSCHLYSHFLITQESCGSSGQKGNDQNHPLWASFWIWKLNQQTFTMRELFLELGPINVNFQRCLPSLFSFPHPSFLCAHYSHSGVLSSILILLRMRQQTRSNLPKQSERFLKHFLLRPPQLSGRQTTWHQFTGK